MRFLQARRIYVVAVLAEDGTFVTQATLRIHGGVPHTGTLRPRRRLNEGDYRLRRGLDNQEWRVRAETARRSVWPFSFPWKMLVTSDGPSPWS